MNYFSDLLYIIEAQILLKFETNAYFRLYEIYTSGAVVYFFNTYFFHTKSYSTLATMVSTCLVLFLFSVFYVLIYNVH